MKEITTFDLGMSAIRAWSHVVDLAAFTLWHPSYRFCGNAAPDAEVDLTFNLLKGEWPLKTEATVVGYERASRFAWQTGLGGVLAMREEYAFDEAGSHTRVRHTVAIEGVLSPFAYVLRRRLHTVMRAQDAALVRYLNKEARGGSLPLNRQRRRVRKAQLARKAAND